MSEPSGRDYDEVTYPTMAHPQTFTDLLSTRGYMRGLDVARPSRCRVLELGCGDGFNLAAMAVLHPEASYTGIDYAAETIARGRKFLGEVGLDQVRLEAADIREIDRLAPTLGEFDYIIAHGVYSWVPADVRDALLGAMNRLLAPEGVGFISYLALPGAYQREMVRTIIRFHTKLEKDPDEKVRQSRAVLDIIANGTTEPNHYTQWMARELELIQQHSGTALYHDELSAVSAPLLFTEFLDHAARHELQFLSEAEYLVPIARALTDGARDKLRPLEANRVLLEQYLDFVEGRRFRQTLLCRPGKGHDLKPERVENLWIDFQVSRIEGATALADPAPLEFHGQKRASIRPSTPNEKALLLTLAEHKSPMPVPAALAGARARLEREKIPLGEDFEPKLRFFLCRACLPGLVDFRWEEPPFTFQVPARPNAHPLARWLLKQDAPSVLSYTGRFVEVNGAPGRHLLSLLDGTRDHAALLAAMRDFLRAGHAAAQARGETATLPSPDDPALETQLERSLAGLTGLGLMKRE